MHVRTGAMAETEQDRVGSPVQRRDCEATGPGADSAESATLRRMGVARADISFLLASRALGASYEHTLMVGRQSLVATPAEVVDAYREVGQPLGLSAAEQLVNTGDGYSEPLFRHLGAREIDSLDNSSYERATIVHDLNEPLPEHLHGRYSVVFDGGSLEHVFNLPQALKNCMQAVAPGGHLITVTPANSFVGHGFYQFSPELHYRALTPANGFEMVTLLIRSGHKWSHWQHVVDPESVRSRVTMETPWPTFLYVMAKRICDVEPFAVWPQQSDYQHVWDGGTYEMSQRTRGRIVAKLPGPLRKAIMVARTSTAVFGTTSGPNHFQRVSMIDVAQGATKHR
jgi:SAM-dependent methyltransferase